MALRSEDLMIGDWVRGFVPDSNSTIYGIFNEQRIVIIAEPSKAYIELSIDDIQPIPLTSKILEKNGFIYQDEKVWGKKKEGITIELDFGKYATLNHKGFWCIGGNAEIHYVHELQHALRLCGIDKEIVL